MTRFLEELKYDGKIMRQAEALIDEFKQVLWQMPEFRMFKGYHFRDGTTWSFVRSSHRLYVYESDNKGDNEKYFIVTHGVSPVEEKVHISITDRPAISYLCTRVGADGMYYTEEFLRNTDTTVQRARKVLEDLRGTVPRES